jgi:hypothetical protein
MLYRSLTALIVVFWLTMTALLIRSELRPADSRMREIPASHVLKLLFLHEQPSELNIRYERDTVGRLRVHPQVRKEDGMRVVEFAGNVQVSVPGLTRERVSWDGAVEMTRLLEMRQVRLGLSFRTPVNFRIEITHDPVAKKGRYELRSGDQVVGTREYVIDGGGLESLFKQLEIPPEMFAMMQSALQSAGPPQPLEISARQSSVDLQGDKIDSCLVTFRQNGQTLGEVHVSQLGQVLRATTLLGYTFSPDEVP